MGPLRALAPAGEAPLSGSEIRQAREQRGLSQDRLGRLVGATGASVGRWERSEVRPQSRFRVRLSAELTLAAGVDSTSQEDSSDRIEGTSGPERQFVTLQPRASESEIDLDNQLHREFVHVLLEGLRRGFVSQADWLHLARVVAQAIEYPWNWESTK